MLYIAPVLLKGRFLDEHYYKHFVKLVQLLTRCIDLEIMHEEIDDLDQNFQKWVQDYERYVLRPLTLMEFCLMACQVVLSRWPGSRFKLPTHCSCLAAYCSNHQSYGPSLGLLGIPNGTLLWQRCSQHPESMVPLLKHQQICYIACTVNPHHPPIQFGWETMPSTACISWPEFDTAFMYVFCLSTNP